MEDDAAISAPGMFHNGSLQSGISRAIQEGKVVACFVHKPADHTSQVWEDYWLVNKSQPTDIISSDTPPLGLVLAEKAVLLKIEIGSREAKFLNAFVKVKKAPTLVIIHNGKVLEKVEADVSREDFTQRVLRAVGFEGVVSAAKRTPEGPPEGLNDDDGDGWMDDIGGRHVAGQQERDLEETTDDSSSPSTDIPLAQQTEQSANNVQAMMAERSRKIEADRLRREAAAKAERITRANARRKEEEAAAATPSPPPPSQSTGKGKQRATDDTNDKSQARDAWIYQQNQRKNEARKERERILAQIEADKQERKAQQQRRKDVETTAGGGGYSEISNSSLLKSSTSPVKTHHHTCAIQVRLFDGSSIRGKFSPDADITTAVRTWVKEASPEGGADIPFTFRQILAPKPSRTIEVGEEHHSLLELGLVPSATLVLVPVAGATSAYSGGMAGKGYVSAAYSTANWAVNSVFGVLGSVASYIPGFGDSGAAGPYMGGTADEQEPGNTQGARIAGSDTAAPGGAARRANALEVRTKSDDVATFYNGNSSAFQGRRGDEDDDNASGR